MAYAVKEIFHTLQGEGANTGRSAVFLRFAGCNLWSGRQEDRDRAACRFCDTDFVGGESFPDAKALAERVRAAWPRGAGGPALAVCTGGEPALQLDGPLIAALHDIGFEVAIETNGTRPLPPGLDWVCVSPKAGTELLITAGDELKLVFPQEGAPPEAFAHLPFRQFLLQAMDGPARDDHLRAAIAYCLTHPQWRLSLQTHKLLGLP